MFARTLIALAATCAVACVAWAQAAHPEAAPKTVERPRSPSVFAELLPRDNPMIPALDRAYADLELAMRPHGCVGCHAPDDPVRDRSARVRHASQLLSARRAIMPMLRANLMPPATDDHAAGIADPSAREELIERARTFQILGDYALESK
jgi:hypothetical protein